VPRRGWLLAGLGLNLAIALALPVAAIFADSWRIGSGNLVMARWVGPAAVSRWTAEIARAEGLDTVVSDSRPLLADFFYTLRDSGLAIYAQPAEGFPPNHYAQQHPLPPGPGDVLFVTRTSREAECTGAPFEQVATWTPELGFVTTEIRAYRVPRACWYPNGS
jgi:hypothetical protein